MEYINPKMGRKAKRRRRRRRGKSSSVRLSSVRLACGGKRQNRIVRLGGWPSTPSAQFDTNRPSNANTANTAHSSRIFPPFRFCSFAPNFNLTSSSSPTHVHFFLLVRTTQSLPESPLLLLIGLQRWDWFHSSVDFDCNRVVNNSVREVGE